MEVPCRLWGPGLLLPSSAAVFRVASRHPAVWLSVSWEGTGLPGHWINQCSAPREQCCLPHTGLANLVGEKARGTLRHRLEPWGPSCRPGTQICHLVPPLCSLQFSAQGRKQLLSPPLSLTMTLALGTVPVPWMGREPSGPQGLRSLRWASLSLPAPSTICRDEAGGQIGFMAEVCTGLSPTVTQAGWVGSLAMAPAGPCVHTHLHFINKAFAPLLPST